MLFAREICEYSEMQTKAAAASKRSDPKAIAMKAPI
jgi:hypothetical protein